MLRLLRNIFYKNVRMLKNIDDDFIYLFPFKKIKMNNNIVVKPGYSAVFVVKGKVTDVVNEGKYHLDWNLLADSSRVLKLYNKKKLPKKFKADVYYVNLKLFNELEFKSNKPFMFKSVSLGKIVANSFGLCSIQITNPKLLLGIMLREHTYLNNKIVKQLISYYVGNEVNLLLEKSKMSFEEIINSNKVVNNYLDEVMLDALFEVGLRVSSINFNSIQTTTKKQQNKINNYIAYQCEYNLDNKNNDFNSILNINESLNLKTCEDSYVYVTKDGRAQDKITICPNCKAKVSGRFCNNCGIKLY